MKTFKRIVLDMLLVSVLVPAELLALHLSGAVSWDPAAGKKYDRACSRDLTVIATALDHYQHWHAGVYPETLDGLVPDYMRAVPTCPRGTAYQVAPGARSYTLACVAEHWLSDYPRFYSTEGIMER